MSDERIVFRVTNLSSEMKTTRELLDSPPTSPSLTSHILLESGNDFTRQLLQKGDGLAQRLRLTLFGVAHPFLDVAVDDLFELVPVVAAPLPSTPPEPVITHENRPPQNC